MKRVCRSLLSSAGAAPAAAGARTREEVDVPKAARWVGYALAVALAAWAPRTRAVLGENETSIGRDRVALAMERQPARAHAAMTVHELRKATQTVREFVDRSGTVFAVAWSGIAPPDLPRLLGAYHQEYRAAAAKRAARGPRRVESAHVVVETWGHGRALQGRAWIPSLVPAGANLDDVQ
jgi:hypothetical protein